MKQPEVDEKFLEEKASLLLHEHNICQSPGFKAHLIVLLGQILSEAGVKIKND